MESERIKLEAPSMQRAISVLDAMLERQPELRYAIMEKKMSDF